ncbi:MAG: hypothetical protein SGILL_006878 [Bacillariaceae sp.]
MPLALPTDTTAKLTAITEEDPNNMLDASSHHHQLSKASSHQGKKSSVRNQKQLLPDAAWKNLNFADFDKSPLQHDAANRKSSKQGIMLGTHVTTKSASKSKKKSKKSKQKGVVTSKKATSGKDVLKPLPAPRMMTKFLDAEDDMILDTPYVNKPISTSELTAATQDMTESERSEDEDSPATIHVQLQKTVQEPKPKSLKKKKKSKTKAGKDGKKKTKTKKQSKKASSKKKKQDVASPTTVTTVQVETLSQRVIKQEVHRADEMKQTIEDLQERVLGMQQNELDSLTDMKGRMVELQALVERQTKEIEDLQKKLHSKEDTIAFLMKEMDKLKKGPKSHYSSQQKTPERKDSSSRRPPQVKEKTVPVDPPASPKSGVIGGVRLTPPSAPKSAKKEKVKMQGIKMKAFKPPL